MGKFIKWVRVQGENILGFWEILIIAYGSRAYLHQGQKQNTPPSLALARICLTLPLLAADAVVVVSNVLIIHSSLRSITMFASISMFVRQFFNMLTTTMSAGDHAAKALEHLAITAEETAGAYCDEARSNRAKQLQQLEADLHVATENTKRVKAA